MADIVLDVPLAYIMLDRFIERLAVLAFLLIKSLKTCHPGEQSSFIHFYKYIFKILF